MEEDQTDLYGKEFSFKLTSTFTEFFKKSQTFKFIFVEPVAEEIVDEEEVLDEGETADTGPVTPNLATVGDGSTGDDTDADELSE